MANTKITSNVIADNAVGISALNVSDGSNGQALTTNGSGTLSFSTISAGATFKTFGTSSFMVGDDATGTINAADYNTGVGVDVFAALTEGNNNVAVGFNALTALTTGIQNTAIGTNALQTLTTASYNVAIGQSALLANTTGTRNVAVGSNALDSMTTGYNSTAVGHAALTANTTANSNTAIGAFSMESNTTGAENAALGEGSLLTNTTGANNVALGYLALRYNTTASYNTAVGSNALTSNTTGTENTAVGSEALDANTTGTHNVAIGREAMGANTGGYENTCVGNQAGANITTGYHNVVLGHRSGFEGNNITTGINNTLVGCFAKPSSSTVDGELILGRNARGQGGSTGSLGISGTGVHIAFNGSTTSWSAHSDERLKENIADSTAGLSFINDLRPITYNWKSKKDISEDFVNYYDADSDEPVQGQVKQTNHGFIAQEIKAAIDAHPEIKEGHSIWRESPDGVQNVADGALMPMMVKALQELSAKNDALEARIQKLEE